MGSETPTRWKQLTDYMMTKSKPWHKLLHFTQFWGPKEMGTHRPWNWKLAALKTIKLMLVRPLMTNFKMTVRAEWTAFAGSPFHSGKALALDYVGMGELAFGQMFSSSPNTASEIKPTPPSWPVYWLLSCEQPHPAFGHAVSQTRLSDWAYTYALAPQSYLMGCFLDYCPQ